MTTALVASRGRLPDWLWGWACDKCGASFRITDIIPAEYAKSAAEECCVFKCGGCGAATSGSFERCSDCEARTFDKRESERLAAAELVEHTGPVWIDGDWFDDAFEAAEEGHSGRAWIGQQVPLRLDAVDILERSLRGYCEGAWYAFGDGTIVELQVFLDKWAQPFAKVFWEPIDKVCLLPDVDDCE